MGLKSKKTPYQGLWIFVPMMLLPSAALTWLFYEVIALRQPQYGYELNWATAKILGCGSGFLFHMICWIMGAFKEDLRAVKTRLKEFSANIVVSARLAFACYWDDVKTLGLAFWIDFSLIALNAGVVVDAVLDYLVLRGFR